MDPGQCGKGFQISVLFGESKSGTLWNFREVEVQQVLLSFEVQWRAVSGTVGAKVVIFYS